LINGETKKDLKNYLQNKIMSLERHDYSEAECNNNANTVYVESYMNWITPQVYGKVCDLGSGLGYPTVKYAEKENVESVLTNDKFFDEKKTVSHEKITRYTLSTEDFIALNQPQFDSITCTEHIEHLVPDSQMKVLEWVKTHLNEGGSFYGSMPDCERSGNPYHLKEYTHGQWEEILKRYFDSVEVVVLLPNLLYVWKASNPKLQ
jgi:2-polyprenyl-3-methyl-5-hydroxy-6-metoxy-1,4-benzoquinol methylase